MSNAWAGSVDMRWLSLREQITQNGRSPLRETTPATNVPNFMISGTFLNRWEEESSNIQDCFLKVDPEGFFVTYQDADKDAVTIDMCHVSDCRSGLVPKDARIRDFLDSMAQESLEDRSITIYFGPSLAEVSALHFVSTSSKVIKEWIEGINDLALRRPFANPSVLLLLRKQHARIKSMVNAHGKIPVRNIVKCMSCSKFEQRLAEGLQGLDLISGKNDYVEPSDFTMDKFYKLYEFLCPRQDLDTVFSKRCTGKTRFLTVQHLVQFLNDEQRDPRLNEILHPYWNVEKTAGLVREFEPAPALAQKDCLSIEGWTRFLMSDHNVVLKPSVLALHQEMSHPLSHYFIHSSHNTYLVGRQFGGKSSVEMYRQCLLAGCRCIELDCWDGPGDEPIITHGKAMCTNILFKDVIYAIKETAFVTSPFPLILSFENHCLRLQQRKLASYCIEIFGDFLLTKNLDDWPLEKGKELPPPNKLMYKILIKNKKLRADIEQSGFTYDCDSADGADCSNEDAVKVANSGEEQEGGDCMVDGFFISGPSESLSVTSTAPEPMESSKLRLPPPQKRLSVISEQSLSTDNPDPIESTLREKKDSESLSNETVEEEEDSEGLTFADGSCDGKETTDTMPIDDKDDCDANGNRLNVIDNSYRLRSFTEGVQHQAALTQVVSHISGMSTQKSDGLRRANKGKLLRLQRSASFEEPCSEDLCNGRASKNEEDNGAAPENVSDIVDNSNEQDTNDDIIKTHLRRKLLTNTNRARLLREQTLEKSLSISMDSLPKGKESLGKSTGKNVSNALDLAEDSRSSSLKLKRKKRFTHSRSSSGDSNSAVGGEDRFQEPMRKTTATVSNVTLSGSGGDTEYEVVSAVDEERPRKDTRSSSHGSVSSQTSISGAKSHKKNSRTASLSAEDESEMMVGYPAATKNIDPLLSSLVNYIQPTAFPGFEEAEEQDLSFKMSSFNETSAYQLVRSSPVEFARYNKKQLSRIYPKGTRVDSTNYNPQVFWNVGCQMVSLNLQTTDLAFQLNQGKFEVNGQSGYILKPEVLRRPNKVFDPFMESPIDNVEASSVSVKVISGQFLTDKKCNTYVVVDMYGLPADTKRKNKTKLAGSTFMNTLYNEESFVFNKVVLSELVLLRFAVYDENDKLLGQRVLPLDGIQPGYRHIPLRSEANVPLSLPTLFVYITVKTYVPEKFLLYIDGLVEPMKYQSNLEQRDETLKVFDDEDDVQSEDSAPSQAMASYRVPSLSVLQSTSISIEHQRQTRSESTLTLSMPAKMQGGMRSAHNTSTANLHLIVHNGEVKLLETMSADSIKRDKNYQKILKKHQKEKDNLHRRHDKERSGQNRQHESQIEKMKSVYVKTVLGEERALEKTLRKIIDESRKEELKQQHQQKIEFMEKHQNEKLAELNKQHTAEVEVTRARQSHEEAGLRCYQAVVEVEYLRRLLHNTQEQELKQMKESQEMGRLELQREQTRQSMDGTRELNLDRNIKSKEERERLQRELNKNNVERFKQERENLRKRQESDLEELIQKQQQVSKAMEEEFQQLLDGEKQKYRDATIKKRKTCLF